MLALIQGQTFQGLVPEGGWFFVPGVGSVSPAQAYWPGPDGWRLVPVTLAPDPLDGFRRVGLPTYMVAGDTVVETYAEEPVQVEVPSSVTRAQAKIALYNANLLTNTEALVANHPYPPVRIWYADATLWERANPYVNALATELGLSEEQVDDLFVAASLITE